MFNFEFWAVKDCKSHFSIELYSVACCLKIMQPSINWSQISSLLIFWLRVTTLLHSLAFCECFLNITIFSNIKLYLQMIYCLQKYPVSCSTNSEFAGCIIAKPESAEAWIKCVVTTRICIALHLFLTCLSYQQCKTLNSRAEGCGMAWQGLCIPVLLIPPRMKPAWTGVTRRMCTVWDCNTHELHLQACGPCASPAGQTTYRCHIDDSAKSYQA